MGLKILCTTCKKEQRSTPGEGIFGANTTRFPFCLEHRPTPYFTRTKRCEMCGINASFGTTENPEKRCNSHKLPGMFNSTNKMCETCGLHCASFGEEKGKPKYCAACNERKLANVKSRHCICGGSTQARYAMNRGIPPKHCFKCKEDGMIDIRAGMCVSCGKTQCVFGIPEGDKTHCAKCKTDDMVDLKNGKCQCGKSQPNYGDAAGNKRTCCMYCSPPESTHFYRGSTGTKKVREITMVKYIESQFHEYKWKVDKPVKNYGDNRPDMLLDMGEYAIIIECDEGGHVKSKYPLEDEEARIQKIWKALGKDIVVIRFNPGAMSKVHLLDGKLKILREVVRRFILAAPSEAPIEIIKF